MFIVTGRVWRLTLLYEVVGLLHMRSEITVAQTEALGKSLLHLEPEKI